ncbi:MAG: discoidin domain-containing protein [Methanophagales archaeon]|nr:discoidin domain-containing protein [Methanophagales archaeon]
MVKSSVTTIVPPTHAAKHCVGGADPLILPLVHHASTHETGGDDELILSHISMVKDVTPTCDYGWTTSITNLDNITDGDLSTKTTNGWSNAADDVEITKIDIGSVEDCLFAVVRFMLDGYSNDAAPTAYFEISDDDSNWETLFSQKGTVNAKDYSKIVSIPYPIRYVRLRVVHSGYSETEYYSIREIGVYR